MPVVINPESEYGKELAKWNVRRPPTYFPRMLYMARKRPDGVVSVCETDDALFRNPGGPDRPGAAEQFNTSCQKTVRDERELSVALEQGWRESPKAAMERHEAKEITIGNEAAHRLYEDSKMSEKAQAEAKAADAETPDHLPVIPEKRRPGRPRKES